MISWHASALHAALSTVRELIHERAEAASDLVASIRESVDAAARVDLVSLTVAKLVRRVDRLEQFAINVRDLRDLDRADRQRILDRLAALEAATDTYGSK